jgi:hypothetical protein
MRFSLPPPPSSNASYALCLTWAIMCLRTPVRCIYLTCLNLFSFVLFLASLTVAAPKSKLIFGDTLISRAQGSPLSSVTDKPANDAYWAYDPEKDPEAALNGYTGPLDEFNDGLPYPCRVCRAINKPQYDKQWYVVARGFEVGIVYGLVSLVVLILLYIV